VRLEIIISKGYTAAEPLTRVYFAYALWSQSTDPFLIAACIIIMEGSQVFLLSQGTDQLHGSIWSLKLKRPGLTALSLGTAVQSGAKILEQVPHGALTVATSYRMETPGVLIPLFG
jgi:hypothetical protein